MARCLANAKPLATSLVDGLSLSVFRRGYAVAPHGAVPASFARGGYRSGAMGKVEEVTKQESNGGSNAWAPDPVTGYYRPANCVREIDPAELREMLLSHRARPH